MRDEYDEGLVDWSAAALKYGAGATAIISMPPLQK